MNFLKKNMKKIIVLGIILVILLLAWLIIGKPFLEFKTNEKVFLEAGKRFYEVNSTLLPTGSRISTVYLQKLYDKDFITSDLKTTYKSELCDNNSWIKVRKENNEYKYYVYLKCGMFVSKNVDHEGPKLTLKGNDTIEISRTDEFKDPGVSSVTDNTDGNIDISKVKIDNSKVNTNRNGTYEIRYSVKDSFGNETVKVRKVIVNQLLGKTVEKNTEKTNNYYKSDSMNNYIMIDGMVFRIIGINEDKTIKVVSDDAIASVDVTSIDEWLNEYFYKSLSEKVKKYIVSSKWCIENVSNPDQFNSCNNYSKKKNVGLLSVADLNNTKADTYLFGEGTSYKLLTSNEYYLDANSKLKKIEENQLYGIRPVLNIRFDTKIVSGSGKNNSPYKLSGQKSSKAGTKVDELRLGEYIEYSGYNWRIADKTDDGYIKIVMADVLTDQDESIVTEFDSSKKYYNNDSKTNLGYKIQNEYSKHVNTKIFEKYSYDIYKYNDIPKYKDKVNSISIKAKLIEVSMFDIFGTSVYTDNSYWYRESNKKTGYINYLNFGVGGNSYTSNSSVKLTGYISSSNSVKSGNGTYDEPYKLAN